MHLEAKSSENCWSLLEVPAAFNGADRQLLTFCASISAQSSGYRNAISYLPDKDEVL